MIPVDSATYNVIPRATSKKTRQRHTLKITMDKSKRYSKKCSSDTSKLRWRIENRERPKPKPKQNKKSQRKKTK